MVDDQKEQSYEKDNQAAGGTQREGNKPAQDAKGAQRIGEGDEPVQRTGLEREEE